MLAKDTGFLYVMPFEKYVIRSGGKWDIEHPYGPQAITKHLIASGMDRRVAASIVKDDQCDVVYGIDMAPGKPSVFDNADGRMQLNVWSAPRLAPSPGPFPRIQAVLDWMMRGDPEGQTWFMHWLAAKVQRPLFLPKVAVLFSGKPGSGKGTLARVIFEMLGPDNCVTIKSADISGTFNAIWARKLFVFADEVMDSDNYRDITDKLKIYIDGNTITSEQKYQPKFTVRNDAAWIFATNDNISPIPIEEHDRRYTVFCNHDLITDEYKSLVRSCYRPEDKNEYAPGFPEEIAGFWAHLLALEVDYRLISDPHVGEARKQFIEASLPSHEQFLREVSDGGFDQLLEAAIARDPIGIGKPETWDFGDAIATRVVYACYLEFCRRAKCKPRTQAKFGSALQHREDPWVKVRRVHGNTRVYCYVIPGRAGGDGREQEEQQ